MDDIKRGSMAPYFTVIRPGYIGVNPSHFQEDKND